MSRRTRKKQAFERAANPFAGMRMGNGGTPGSMYIIPESVVKQVIANFAPQKAKSEMYSPGAPIRPIPEITPAAGPRGWNYPTGINLSGVDRTLGNTAYDIPSFQQLRMLARMYDGITLCERVILDMIPMLELDVVPIPGLLEDGEDTRKYQKDITTYKKWFEKPDRQHDYHSWLRIAYREQTQIDELYIYKKPNRGGGLYALQIVAGDTIKPLQDEQGIMPLPPFPAYQQFPYGAPGGLYTSDQFIHYQESPASDTPYGFSRVERIILRVNIALRKENKDLYRYTEGNIPAGIMEVPEASNWTPDQIDAFEQSWNALMAGNLQQATRIKFAQPGMKYTQFAQPEANLHLTEFDQFLLNVTAGCYGLSMQDLAFTGDIHKSSGDSQQNVMYRRSLYPFISVYAKILTDVLHNDFNDPRFMVVFKGFEEAEDVAAKATAYSTLTGAGILGISDAGKLMKLPEDKNAAHIGRILVGKDGPIFLDDIASDKMREAAAQAKLAGYALASNPPQSPPQQPAPAGGGAQPSGDDEEVEKAMDEADKSLATLSRSDSVRGPHGEFGYAGGPQKAKGPRRSPREQMQTRAQKLSTRFAKLTNRKLGKHWGAAQHKAASALQSVFSQIAAAMAKGGQSQPIDSLLDQANAQAKILFAGKPKGLAAMSSALTKMDNANDAGLFRAASVAQDIADEEEGEEEGMAEFVALAAAMDDLEDEEEEMLGRVVEMIDYIENYLRQLRAQQKTEEPDGQEVPEDLAAATSRATNDSKGIGGVTARITGDSAVSLGGGGTAPDSEKAVSQEYRRWRERALGDVKAGRQMRPFVSEVIPEQDHLALTRALAECTTADEVRAAFERARERETSFFALAAPMRSGNLPPSN